MKLREVSFPGFEPEESIYNHDKFTNLGIKLLTEYAIIPEKFLFFDVNISNEVKAEAIDYIKNTKDNQTSSKNNLIENLIEIIIPINENIDPSSKSINKDILDVMCTPVINLFPSSSEYIHINHKKSYYKLYPYKRSERLNEIYSIEEVISQRENSQIKYQPYFGVKDVSNSINQDFWIDTREISINKGTETFLSFISSNKNFEEEVAYANVICTNRSLPSLIDQNTEFFSKSEGISFRSISNITELVEPPIGLDLEWSIISHLATSHISFSNLNSLEKIKDLIKLYQFIPQSISNNLSNCILDIKLENSISPYRKNNIHFFIPKITISILLDDSLQDKVNLFLLGKILHKLFETEIEINTCIETIIIKKSTNKVWKKYSSDAKRQLI
jgi:type VI secretion system protein ImpG